MKEEMHNKEKNKVCQNITMPQVCVSCIMIALPTAVSLRQHLEGEQWDETGQRKRKRDCFCNQ